MWCDIVRFRVYRSDHGIDCSEQGHQNRHQAEKRSPFCSLFEISNKKYRPSKKTSRTQLSIKRRANLNIKSCLSFAACFGRTVRTSSSGANEKEYVKRSTAHCIEKNKIIFSDDGGPNNSVFFVWGASRAPQVYHGTRTALKQV